MSDYLKGPISLDKLIKEPGATGILANYKDHTDPKYIGPGTWNVIHRRAFKARTHDQQLTFIDFMKDICYGFPCTICKGHCTEHIKNHPMEEYLDILVDINGEKLPIGLFVWAWKFHNAVNARLKKPIMSWDTAYNLYSESESLVCSKNCLQAENPIPDGIENNEVSQPNPVVGPQVPKLPEFKFSSVPTSNQSFRLVSINRK